MKTTRPYVVLLMLFHLIDNGKFTEMEIRTEINLSRSSFFRALSDFRCFLQEYRPWQSLTFDEVSKSYRLETITI